MSPVTRRLAGAAAAALLVGALAGCGSPAPSVSSDEAIAAYGSVLDEVREGLEAEFPAVVWTSDEDQRVQRDSNDSCTLVFELLESPMSLREAAGDWDAIAAVVDPVLSERGFPALSEDDIPGGWTGVSAVDEHGARFDMIDKGLTKISLDVDVTDTDCAELWP